MAEEVPTLDKLADNALQPGKPRLETAPVSRRDRDYPLRCQCQFYAAVLLAPCAITWGTVIVWKTRYGTESGDREEGPVRSGVFGFYQRTTTLLRQSSLDEEKEKSGGRADQPSLMDNATDEARCSRDWHVGGDWI